MKDELVSFECAKLAKEKGFDWKVLFHYKGSELINNGKGYDFNSPEEQKLWNIEITSAPTQSLLQKWLREKHKIYVEIHYNPIDKDFSIHIKNENTMRELFNMNLMSDRYESILEAALIKALELIK